MKILNLFSGIGGNRKLWGNKHKITAVEINPEIAKIYTNFFPEDILILGDAHQYLLERFFKFDFIWSSPPCQSHSSFRFNICVRYRDTKTVYPDMRLYQEILFLNHNFKGKWVVENVKPYYKPLIEPSKILQRHLFWSNFNISDIKTKQAKIRTSQILQLSELHGFDLANYKLPNKRQVLRNCVLPELGSHILKEAESEIGE